MYVHVFLTIELILFPFQFQAEEQLQFRTNMAFYVNVHCSVQGTCDIWTVHPDDIPLQHMAAPYLHQKRHLLQEDQPVIIT